MNREVKLALILGTALVLIVGVLISDHFSGARRAALDGVADEGLAASFEVAAGVEDEPVRLPEPAATLASAAPVDGGAPALSAPTVEREEARFAGNPAGDAELFGPIPVLDMGAAARGGEQLAGGARQLIEDAAREGVRIIDLSGAPTAGQTDRTGGARSGEAAAARQEAPAKAEPRRDVRLHKVKSNESLWSIAEREYGDGALYAKLMEFNRDRLMEDGGVREGTNIILPTREELDAGELRPAARPQAQAKPAAAPAGARTHVVQRGDTLGTIAERYLGTSRRWREISELNKLSDPDRLLVGATLKIPAR